MREQSHKHEMADALRGDFARLRARGVATTLEPAAPQTVRAVPPAPVAVTTEPGPPPASVPAAPAGAPEPKPESGGTADVVAAPSWLQRLLGR